MIFKIYQLLSKIKLYIIHFNGRALVYSLVPILIKRISSFYTVYTMAHEEYNKYIRRYIKSLFNTFPSIITPVAISQSVSETIKKTYGVDIKRTIYNGSSELTISSKSKIVVDYINDLKKDKEALRVPVLSTPSGVSSDIIIPGINGCISERITVKSHVVIINSFIEKSLKNTEEITELYKEKYTLRACASQYLEFYKTKLSKMR